jgi:CRISPR system Cascade subunit CasB
MMADLRCALVENKRHRAWPVLHRLGVVVTNREAAVVAALFAMHPEEAAEGNFGATCRVLQSRRGDNRSDDSKLTPIERRFLHLLAAERGDELHQRVTRMVLLAKSQGVPVNYDRLETDLKFWNDRTKNDWAAAFWAPEADPALPSSVDDGGES